MRFRQVNSHATTLYAIDTHIWYTGADNPYIVTNYNLIDASDQLDILGHPIIEWDKYKKINPYIYFYERNPIISFNEYMDIISNSKMRKSLNIEEEHNIIYELLISMEMHGYICDSIARYRDLCICKKYKSARKIIS